MLDCVGLKLGNYRLVRLVGNGGFADVYQGEHVYLKTEAAIKVLHTRLPDKLVQNFLIEARNHARLSHPNIVRVLDFGIENNIPFLVMSYAPHGTLRQKYPIGSVVEAATIILYVKQVAAALQYAHNRKILHRDIKPENMLISNEGTILLSDFGISIAFHNIHNSNMPSILSVGAGTAGTTTYMAPEQFHGTPYYTSDQYALATVAYEWFCGTPPFTGSDLQIAVKHMYRQPPLLSEKLFTMNAAIEEVVMKALSKRPQDRFASVQLFADALESASQIVPSRPFPAKQATISSKAINRNGDLLLKDYGDPLIGPRNTRISAYMQDHLKSLSNSLPAKAIFEKSPSTLFSPAAEVKQTAHLQRSLRKSSVVSDPVLVKEKKSPISPTAVLTKTGKSPVVSDPVLTKTGKSSVMPSVLTKTGKSPISPASVLTKTGKSPIVPDPVLVKERKSPILSTSVPTKTGKSPIVSVPMLVKEGASPILPTSVPTKTRKSPIMPISVSMKTGKSSIRTSNQKNKWSLLAFIFFCLSCIVAIPFIAFTQAGTQTEKKQNQFTVIHTSQRTVKTTIPVTQAANTPVATKNAAVPIPTKSLVGPIVSPTAIAVPDPTSQLPTPSPTFPPVTPTPVHSSVFRVGPSFLSPANCVPDNNAYRCTIRLTLSANYYQSLSWSADSVGIFAFFNSRHGTLKPGQSKQIIVYVVHRCPSQGSFVFTGNGLSTSATWSC